MRKIWCLFLILLVQVGHSHAHKKIDSLYVLGEQHFKEGEYGLMLNDVLAALKIADAEGNCQEKANATMRVARGYYHVRQKRAALKLMLDTREMGFKCKIDSFIYKGARQAGAIYFEYAIYDSSMMYLQEAERYLIKAKDYGELSSVYSIMSDVHYYRDTNLAKMRVYENLAEEYGVKSGNKNSLAFAFMKRGIHATFLKDCKNSQLYFNKAWDLYKELHMIEGEMYAMSSMAWALSECGKAKEGYELVRKLMYLKDSVFREETANKTALFRTRYETEKKERENLILSKDVSLKKLQIANEKKSKRQLAIIFGISVIALVAVFMVAYSRYRLKKKAELAEHLVGQEQIRFKAVIEAEENERERIAADLHDGVGQMMSAAKINLSAIESEIPFATEEQRNVYRKVVALVDESCREVRVVSHSMMPNALLKSGLVNAIRSFINQIDSRVIQINLYTEGLNERMNNEIETVLYRVVQECVNNVIKHSKASQLDISIIKDEDGISATIEDNGVGFNIADKSKFEGIGIKNIISRITYLKGTVEWDSAPGKGTVVAIHLPVA